MNKNIIPLLLGSLPFLIPTKNGSLSKRRKKRKTTTPVSQTTPLLVRHIETGEIKRLPGVRGAYSGGEHFVTYPSIEAMFEDDVFTDHQKLLINSYIEFITSPEGNDPVKNQEVNNMMRDEFQVPNSPMDFDELMRVMFSENLRSGVITGQTDATVYENNPTSLDKQKKTLIYQQGGAISQEHRERQLASLYAAIQKHDGVLVSSFLTGFQGKPMQMLIKYGHIWKGADAIKEYRRYLPLKRSFRDPYLPLHSNQAYVNELTEEEANIIADYRWSQMNK